MVSDLSNNDGQISLTGPVDQVRYLTVERSRYYRAIMRLVYEKHEQHEYRLRPEQVHAAIAAQEDGYNLEQAVLDLDFLEGRGNLLSSHSSEGLNTITAFKNRRKVYQATNIGIEIERFLRSLENRSRHSGALNVSALESLWDHVLRLEDRLRQPEALRVAQAWTELFTVFQSFRDDANDYFAQMDGARRRRMFSHDSFLIYRDSLVRYLREFADALQIYAPRFRDRLARWEGEGLMEILGERIATASLQPAEEPAHPTEIRSRVYSEWTGLKTWFTPGGSVDTVRSIALDAIALVARQARYLAERSRTAAARHEELLLLAGRFARCELAQAHRLGAVVFGGEPARQWYGDGAPTTEASLISGGITAAGAGLARDPWQTEPLIHDLYPVVRGGGDRQSRPMAAIRDRSIAKEAHIRTALAERQAAAHRIAALFGPTGVLQLTHLTIEDMADWQLIVDLLRECLCTRHHKVTALDGSIIVLENPHAFHTDDAPVRLRTPQGVLVCPPFRLRRTSAEASRGKPSNPGSITTSRMTWA